MNAYKFKDFNNPINSDHWMIKALNKLQINIKNWNAWSPCLTNRNLWINWALESERLNALSLPPIGNSLSPSINFLPIALRKKLSPITKILLFLFHDSLDVDERKKTQVVFSSRYGEARSTVELLESLGKSELGSPMAFSRSVHNFGVGLNAIANGNKSPNTAIAAMENSFYAGLLESLIQLNTSECASVMYIYAEDSNMEMFEKFYKIPVSFGVSFLLTKDIVYSIKPQDQESLFTINPETTIFPETESLQFIKNVICASE